MQRIYYCLFMCVTGQLVVSCSFFKKKSSSTAAVSQESDYEEVTATIDDNGVTKATISSQSTKPQLLKTSGGDIDGSSVLVQPGAFALDTEVTLEKATIPEGSATILSTEENKSLSLSSAEAAGDPVILDTTDGQDPIKPLTLSIPFSSSSGLYLNDNTVEFSTLLVLYKYKDKENEGSFKLGVISRDKLQIVDGKVQFETSKLGVYQPVETPRVVNRVIEEVSASVGFATIKDLASGVIDNNGFKIPSADTNNNGSSIILSEINQKNDLIPPAKITFFSGTSGAITGEIKLSWKLPKVTSDYDTITLHRKKGSSAPSSTCDNASKIKNWQSSDFIKLTSYSDKTGSKIGEKFSYRICIFDKAKNVSTSTALAVRAYDKKAPQAALDFTASYDSTGQVVIKIEFPSDTSDYDSLDIVAWNNAVPPECDEGEIIQSLSSFQNTSFIENIQTTGSRSYRLCILDTSGNLQSDNTTILESFDTTPPPAPIALYAISDFYSSGKIKLNLSLPQNLTDYSHIELHRKMGYYSPLCNEGDVINVNGPFVPYMSIFEQNLVPGSYYSYRVCAYDQAGNVDSTLTGGGTASDVAHIIFATSQTFTGNLGGDTGADQLCQNTAQSSSNTNIKNLTFKAVISSDSSHANSRLMINGKVVNTIGSIVADNYTDFWDGSLFAGINYDESGFYLYTTIDGWTGSDSYGNRYSNETCSSWSSESSSFNGRTGSSESGSTSVNTSTATCQETRRLYCISQ